jgi:hypothetical protein
MEYVYFIHRPRFLFFGHPDTEEKWLRSFRHAERQRRFDQARFVLKGTQTRTWPTRVRNKRPDVEKARTGAEIP